MTFTITTNRDVLFAAVQKTNLSVERRNTIPVLANLMLEPDEAGKLTIAGTDLDSALTVATDIDAGDLPAGGITIPGGLLEEILRKLPAKTDIKLTQDDKSATVILSSGRSRFTMHTLPGVDWPKFSANGDGTAQFVAPAGKLAAMLALTAFAVSTEETRYYLNGIYLHRMEGAIGGEFGLCMVATDGHRLATTLLPHPDLPVFPGAIIPRKMVSIMQKILKEADDEAEVEIEINDSRITLRTGTVTITSKLIDGTFPDYKRVIPAGNTNLFRFDVTPLAAASDRVATISSERGRAVKMDWQEDAIKLSVSNPDTGNAEDETPCVMDSGAPVQIGFNSKYLAEMLDHMEGSAVVELGDAGSPAKFQPSAREGDEIGVTFVLMPMRI